MAVLLANYNHNIYTIYSHCSIRPDNCDLSENMYMEVHMEVLCTIYHILQRLQFYKSPTSSLMTASLCAINSSPARIGYKDFENKPQIMPDQNVLANAMFVHSSWS